MSRVRFLPVPKEWSEAQTVLDDHVRSLGSVLDRGFRVREQVRLVRDVIVNTDELPIRLECDLRQKPESVILLSATVVATSDGKSISGGAVTWEWREGVVRLHTLSGLAASTRYNATFAVLE